MQTVYKYLLETNKAQSEIELPKGAEVLTVNEQGGGLHLWALVDPENKPETRVFEVYGTGHKIPKDGHERKFISTIFINGGQFVFHAFEVTIQSFQ